MCPSRGGVRASLRAVLKVAGVRRGLEGSEVSQLES